MKYQLSIFRVALATLITVSIAIPTYTQTRQLRLTAKEIAQRTMPSVVVLVAKNSDGKSFSIGTGFFVRPDLIATCWHVVEKASVASLYAKTVGNKQWYEISDIVSKDKERDLALLLISGSKNQPTPLTLGDNRNVAVGDEVFAVGNPEGLEGTFSQGIVSALRAAEYIQITAPISHGSSGGPVLNNKGEVVGVASATIKNGQNLNFAIPIRYLKPLIASIKTIGALDRNAGITNPAPSFILDESDLLPDLSKNSAKQLYDRGWAILNSSIAGEHYDKRNRRASLYFEAATKKDPNFIDAWQKLGEVYLDLARNDHPYGPNQSCPI